MNSDRTTLRWNGWGLAAHKETLADREEIWSWLTQELGMPALLATPPRALETIALAPSRLGDEERRKFVEIVGEDRVRDDDYERIFHARGRSYLDLLCLRSGLLECVPDAVLYPRSAEEVLALLSYAADRDIAVVPFGGGSSIVGGVNALKGPFARIVTIDLSGLDRLLGLDQNAHTATAEAGIYGPALEKALQARGFTLGHFPQSFEFSTLGGWIAHRGAGRASHRDGGVADWLIGAKLATPRGMLTTGETPISGRGQQLKDFILGSEGSFGVITEATIRIRRCPDVGACQAYLFRDFTSGINAIRTATQAGIGAGMLRLYDSSETSFLNAYGRLGRRSSLRDRLTGIYLRERAFDDAACMLIATFDGTAQKVDGARNAFWDIARGFNAAPLGKAQAEIWRQRRFQAPYLRDAMLDRGVGVDTWEVAESWSRLEGLYGTVRAALRNAINNAVPRAGARGIVLCHVSHASTDSAGLYFTYLFPRALDDEIAQCRAIRTAACEALAGYGSAVGHQPGLGHDYAPLIVSEQDPLGTGVLRAIKEILDPKGILNPGKLIPD